MELMQSDAESTIKQSDFIHEFHQRANKKERELLNNTFIALCGYSLDSIITKPRKYFDMKDHTI